ADRPSSGRLLATGPRAAAGPLVDRELVAEHGQGAADEPNRAVRVAARAAAHQLGGPPLDPGEVVTLGRTARQAGRGIGDRPQPEDARTALRGALAGHVIDDPGGHADATLIVAK